MELQGKVAVVTGGTSGVGRGITERFLQAGAEVLVCARNAPESEIVVGEKAARFVAADVRKLEDIEAVLPTTEFRQDILEPSQNEFIAHCYDFLHPFMTEEQRAIVRRTISLTTGKGEHDAS